MGIHDAIENGQGFYLGASLTDPELEILRGMITAQYIEHFQEFAPQSAKEAARIGIENYHLLQHGFDHGTVWPKHARILPAERVGALKKMAFYQAIADDFGDVSISDDELNWRLVRPHAADDVGPVHADRWFWDIGYGRIPEGWDRFKIWIPVFAEPGLNGLSVKPFSHLRNDWKHHTEIRGGMAKPVFDEDAAQLNMQLLRLAPGEMVMFHDALLHGGVVNRGSRCRVSLELTIFFRKDFQIRRMRHVA